MGQGSRVQVGVPADLFVAANGTAEVDVRFSDDANDLVVPAFRAGDGSIRVRFAAPSTGQWRWVSSSSDAQLDGLRGDIEAVQYAGDNLLYRHGRLRVAAGARHLEHADGTPFLWIGDTWWCGLSSRLDWPDGFGTLLRSRSTSQGSLEPRPGSSTPQPRRGDDRAAGPGRCGPLGGARDAHDGGLAAGP